MDGGRIDVPIPTTPVLGPGKARDAVDAVPGFTDAVRIARHADLVALIARSGLAGPTAADPAGPGVVGFDLSVRTPPIAVSLMWRPRMRADPAHEGLRDLVLAVCRPAAAPG